MASMGKDVFIEILVRLFTPFCLFHYV